MSHMLAVDSQSLKFSATDHEELTFQADEVAELVQLRQRRKAHESYIIE
jgi:hypothetical protein